MNDYITRIDNALDLSDKLLAHYYKYLPQSITFKVFDARLDTAKNQLLSLLSDLKTQGKTIAGYGASVGLTTMIYHFDLSNMLSFIVDDNPEKQNLFSPGHHIPVFSPQIIYERKPDYVLILAWRYAEPIMKKHRTYLDQGGRFIVPLPQIEVVGPYE